MKTRWLVTQTVCEVLTPTAKEFAILSTPAHIKMTIDEIK